ncbi:MAG: YceD family protein [Flavobacteriaceae bacterium]
MEALTEFVIPFVGLKEGHHSFNFSIDTTFFKEFDFSDFSSASLEVSLLFEKKPSMMNLKFTAKGHVGLRCDLTNEPFMHPIATELDWIVKFGDQYDDDHDEYLVLPHGSYQVSVAQPIYEMIVLATPVKKVHPGVDDGTLDSDLLKRLEELQPKEEKLKNNDPRWNKLKDLL